MAYKLQFIMERSLGRSSRPELKHSAWRDASPGLLSYLSCITRSTYLGTVPPTVGGALQHQPATKQMASKMGSQDSLVEAILQLWFPLSRCVKMTTGALTRGEEQKVVGVVWGLSEEQ